MRLRPYSVAASTASRRFHRHSGPDPAAPGRALAGRGTRAANSAPGRPSPTAHSATTLVTPKGSSARREVRARSAASPRRRGSDDTGSAAVFTDAREAWSVTQSLTLVHVESGLNVFIPLAVATV